MALKQTAHAQRIKETIQTLQVGVLTCNLYHATFNNSAFVAASDIFEMGGFPAHSRIVGITVMCSNLAASTNMEIVLLDGDYQSPDDSRDTAYTIASGLDVSGAVAELEVPVTRCLEAPVSDKTVGIGIKLSQDQPAAANKNVILLVRTAQDF